jgi:hypothetical protein
MGGYAPDPASPIIIVILVISTEKICFANFKEEI